MFNQELVILGLLKEGPKHGYQIKKLFHQITESFATIENRSIYYPLKLMEKEGLVEKETKKQLRRPEKFIYKITPKGEDRFHRLIEKNILTIERPFLNVDISLYFLPFVNSELFLRKLRVRKKGLEKVKAWLSKAVSQRDATKPYQRAILSHNFELLKTEVEFNSYLISNFDSVIKSKDK